MPNFSTVSAAVALVLLSACGSGRNVGGTTSSSAECISCHGGVDNNTGAPPTDVDGLTSSAAVGAHTAHLSAAVPCATCHANVNLTAVAFPKHRNGVTDVDFSGAAIDPSAAATPSYAFATHTCSNTYCHAAFTTGAGPKAPRWNQGPLPNGCGSCHTGPTFIHGGRLTLAQCTTCHPTSVDASGKLLAAHANGTVDAFAHPSDWVTPTTTTAHGYAATYLDPAYPTGLQGCKACHGADLTLPVTDNVPSCNKCHGTAWQSNCLMCHGDATNTRQPASIRPAPPRDVAGRTASARVGAHQAHLVGKAVSDGVACTDCHGGPTRTLPTDVAHVNGTTELTLKQPGQNAATGSFDPATGTCSNVYCHGNLPRNPRNPASAPSWTATSGQSACDACHAPNGAYGATDAFTGRHQTHRCGSCHTGVGTFATQVGCYACHPGYRPAFTDLANNTTPPSVGSASIHVDGAVEVVGTTSDLYGGFALTLGYTAPSGATAPSCTTNCHAISGHASAGAPSGAASW